jgi:hypothetical protein
MKNDGSCPKNLIGQCRYSHTMPTGPAASKRKKKKKAEKS